MVVNRNTILLPNRYTDGGCLWKFSTLPFSSLAPPGRTQVSGNSFHLIFRAKLSLEALKMLAARMETT